MPAISKIRLCNIIYENGGKRYNDQLFHFDGQNAALLLENGGGKTVFIQTVLQCVIPHINMADRKIKDTLHLESGPAHIAIEWILNEQPRRYGLTCVSLFTEGGQLNSLKYTFEYSGSDEGRIEELPFKIDVTKDGARPATRGEISEYYQRMAKNNPYAKVFKSITEYGKYLEHTFKIIPSEWRKVAVINSGEGNVDEYFNRCKTTPQLLNNLLIPVVEEAIEGESSTEFAKTFEKQRDHFKKNRILHDKIEQSKGVKEEIDEYVGVYKKYDAKLKDVKKLKGKARTVTELMEERLSEVEKGRVKIEEDRVELEAQQKDYNNQKLSYQVLMTDNKIQSKTKDMEGIGVKLEQLKSSRDKAAKRRQNIQMTKVKRLNDELENELKRLSIELENEEKNLPTSDLKIQLEENSANIKGHFEYELEKLKVEQSKRMEEASCLNQEQKSLKEALGLVKTKELTGKENIIKTKTTIELAKEEMDHIYDVLFESQIGCSVDDSLSKWTYEFENLNQELIVIGNEKLRITSDQERLNKDIRAAKEQLNQLAVEEQSNDANVKLIDELAKSIYDRVNKEGIKVSDKELIYTKEESIKTLLEEKKNYFEEKRQKFMADEMSLMSRELLKDVMHPSIIMAVGALKEEIDYITLGQDYLYQLSESSELTSKALLEKYPLFAMTVVTNRKNKDKVMTRLEEMSKELGVPALVMTIEEIAVIIKGDEEENIFLDNAVIPSLWNDSLTKGYLDGHNATIHDDLVKTRANKEKMDVAWSKVSNLLLDVQRFFEDYAYDDYTRFTGRLEEIEKEMDSVKSGLEENGQKLLESEKEFSELLIEEEVKNGQIGELKGNIQLAKDHEHTYNRYLKLREEEEKQRTEVSDYIYERKGLDYKVERLEVDKVKMLESLKEFEFEIRKITDSPLYKEVMEAEPIAANKDINLLINERDFLTKKLAGLSITRESITRRIEEQTKLYSHYEAQLVRLTKEKEFPFEEIETYYESEEDDLFDEIVGLKTDIKHLESEYKKEEKSRWSYETEKNLLLNDLKVKGETLYEFDCDLAYIPTRLKVLEGTIKDIKRQIDRSEKEFGKQLSKYNQLITQLRIKDGSYNFLGEEGIKLTNREKEKFNQDIESAINGLFKDLGVQSGILKALYYDVTECKEKVVSYCRDHVEDYRLKEAITNGLMEKSDYNELLIYQERMTDIINRTIQLANDDKRESDTELITFLHHLLTYVKSVIHELSILQKKTSIDVDGGKKQIFVFDIPDYDDDEAKESLRLYIDQMIELFEEEKDGDESSIRELIEERLSVKNLIGVVLKQQAIKVKCRKVTNDLKINKAPMSWEHSNKWSGGEKWSKNMTLFLGILNYLAEKKQHLSANQKRNRTVILDNPFGKASSKHVLDPVFFIAENLGFQIIALTAHAEGQFISDYFPVVYSLRLRDSSQPNKLLMTTERVLNYTYLKERAPSSITRLQEAKQLDLFKL